MVVGRPRGNLIWAATIFINPAVGGAMLWIKIMSVTGGIVGAGGLQSALSSNSPEAPTDEKGAKDLLRRAVAKARGKLETHFSAKRFDWAMLLSGKRCFPGYRTTMIVLRTSGTRRREWQSR